MIVLFIKGEKSYLETTQQWLNSVGIIGKWQRPFLSPVRQAYLFGKKDLEDTIRKNWYSELAPLIQPLLKSFPFNKEAEESIDPAQLQNVLHPT